MTKSRADDWRSRGDYFSWRPATADAAAVDIFHVELGDPAAPAVLLLHGWPTSSIDWYAVALELSATCRVCALDFPGYGLSAKPRGWGYSLARDAELADYYLAEVAGADASVVVGHDRGDSVALLHAARCADGRAATRIEHLILSNGNIFLPLSNLTNAQRLMLDPQTWPQVAAVLTPEALAQGMGAGTFTPPRPAGDPDVEAMTAMFRHDDGVQVLHETIQYLFERSQDEQEWLAGLAAAQFPVTLIWGVYDAVSPPRVATYVWNEYLMLRPGRADPAGRPPGAPRGPGDNRLYFVPDANHYLQADRPGAFVQVLLHALGPGEPAPGALSPDPGAPLLVDSSRARLPAAADLLPANPRPAG